MKKEHVLFSFLLTYFAGWRAETLAVGHVRKDDASDLL